MRHSSPPSRLDREPPLAVASRSRSGGEKVSKSQRTRQQLLDVAATVLSERGYARTRLSDIVEPLGLHPSIIYYHFPNKDALVREVLTYGMVDSASFVRCAVGKLDSALPAVDRIVTGACAHVRMILQRDRYAMAALRVIGEVTEDAYKAFIDEHLVYHRFWDALLAEAAATGEVRPGLDLGVLRSLLLSAIGWRIDWHLDGLPATDHVAQTLVDTFLRGILSDMALARAQTASVDLARQAIEAAAAETGG